MASLEPETVVVISPHGPVQPEGVAHPDVAPKVQGDMRRWDAPQVRFDFENDLEAVAAHPGGGRGAQALPLVAVESWDDGALDGLDWGCTVPLYYLRSGFEGARLVVVAPSYQGPEYHYKIGEAIGRALEAAAKGASPSFAAPTCRIA